MKPVMRALIPVASAILVVTALVVSTVHVLSLSARVKRLESEMLDAENRDALAATEEKMARLRQLAGSARQEEARKHLELIQAQIESDSRRWARLKRIGQAAVLNKDHIAEAQGLIYELESRWGPLGIKVNANAPEESPGWISGAIEGIDAGEKALDKAMRQAEIHAREAEIRELDENLGKLVGEAQRIRQDVTPLGP